MNRDNLETAIAAVAVVALIVAFIVSNIPARSIEDEYVQVAPVQEEIEPVTGTEIEVSDRYEEPDPPCGFWIDPEIPFDIQDNAHYYGDIYHISPQLLEAIAWQESRWDPSVQAGGCIGLMQINEHWHIDRMEKLEVSHDDLYTVSGSMHVAADYLAELFKEYEDPAEVLMVYNGDSAVESYRAGGEASEYATSILEMTRELERRYDAR